MNKNGEKLEKQKNKQGEREEKQKDAKNEENNESMTRKYRKCSYSKLNSSYNSSKM